MDNQEHHPHCVFMSNNYSQDYGKPEDDYDDGYDEEDFKGGMGCFLLFLLIVIFSLFSMLIIAEHYKTEKSKQEKRWIEETFAKLEQEEARKEAIKKAMADSMQHAQDSIEKYNYLCDSIAKAQYIQDSANYVLSLDKKVAVDLVAFIDDGITSREVKVNAVGDSITPEEISELGKTFNHMAWTAAKDRQTEIDNNQEYYTKRIINEEQ